MSSFITNPIVTVSKNINTTQITCRQYKAFLPSFTPIIYGLSIDTSVAGSYSLVYITGENFLPNGTTYVNFSNYFQRLPITYYSSNNISFVIPLNALAGVYDVTVVNIYTGNFSLSVNYSYPGNLNYSNSVNYTLT